jgi:hypothetical protein
LFLREETVKAMRIWNVSGTLPILAIALTAAIIITPCSHTQVSNAGKDYGTHVNIISFTVIIKSMAFPVPLFIELMNFQ